MIADYNLLELKQHILSEHIMTLLTDCLRKVLLRPLPRVLISKVMACNIFLKFYNGVKLPALGLGTWQVSMC